MGRKLNLDNLSEEECERILSVVQRDFDIRQKEQERLSQIEEEITEVDKTSKLLGSQENFNDNCCMRCFSTFFFIFNRKLLCYVCKYNVCKKCCDYNDVEQQYICKVCQQNRELSHQSCDWFYNSIKQRFKRFGSAKVVRSLYKRKLDSSESENDDSGYDLSLYSSLPLAGKLRQSVQGLFSQNSQFSKAVTNGDENEGDAGQSWLEVSGMGSGTSGLDASDPEYAVRREGFSCTVPPAVLGNISYNTFDEALHGAEMERSKLQLERIVEELQRSLVSHSPVPSGNSKSQNDGILMKFKFQLSGVLSFMSQSLHFSSHNSYSSDPLMSPNSQHHQVRQVIIRHVEQITGGSIDMSDETTSEYASEDGSNSDLHKAFEEVLADAVIKKVLDEHRRQYEEQYVHEEEAVKQELTPLSSQRSVVTQNLSSGTTPKYLLAAQEEITYENRVHPSVSNQSTGDVQSQQATVLGSEVVKMRDIVSDYRSSELEFRPVCSTTQTPDSDSYDINRNSPNLNESLEACSTSDYDMLDLEFAQLAEQYEKMLNEAPVEEDVIPRAHDVMEDQMSPVQKQEKMLNEAPVVESLSPSGHDVIKDQISPVQEQELRELADIFSTSQRRSEPVVREMVEEIESLSSESPVQEEIITKSEVSRTDAMLPDLDDRFHGLEFVQDHEVSLPSFLEEPLVDDDRLGVDLDDIMGSYANETSSKGSPLCNARADGNNWFFKDKNIISAYDNYGKKKVGKDMEEPLYMFVPEGSGEGSHTPFVEENADELSEVSTCSISTSDLSEAEVEVMTAEQQEINHQIINTSSTSAEDAGKEDKVPNKETDTQTEEQILVQKPQELEDKVPEKSQEIQSKSPDHVVPVGEEKFDTRETDLDMELEEDIDPKFVERPQNLEILQGETAVFECKVCGTSPIDIFWYCEENDDITLLEDGDKYEVQSGADHSRLTVHYTTDSDAGQYMCIAVNEVDRCYCRFGLTLKENPMEQKPPEFLREPQDVEVAEGQSAKFRCKIKGYPYPRVHWYKNGRHLINCDSYRIEKISNRDYTLSFDHVTLDDDAEYTVVAKNNMGEAKTSVQLIVEEEPKDMPVKLASSSGKLTDTQEEMTTTAVDTQGEMTTTIDNVSQSANELSEIYKQLDEMNNSSTCAEDEVSNTIASKTNMDARNNNPDRTAQIQDSEDVLREYQDQKIKADAEQVVVTTALEVLMSAKEVKKTEKENLSEKCELESPSYTSYQDQYEEGKEVNLTFQQFEKLYQSGLVTREALKSRKVKLTREMLEELDRVEDLPAREGHDLTVEGDVTIVMDCGLKRVDSKRYKRDFIINNPNRKPLQKKWEVQASSPLARPGLATMAPSMERSVSMEENLIEAEDQIHMKAEKLYSVEESIKKLESRVHATDEKPSPEVMSTLEEEITYEVAKTELSEREISSLENQTAELQETLRSEYISFSNSQGAPGAGSNQISQNKSQLSESPVLASPEDFSISDSTSESEGYQDLPSVKKLMGAFDQSSSEEEQSYFKRVHSLTARSLSQKTRDLLKVHQKKSDQESPIKIKSPSPNPADKEKVDTTPVTSLTSTTPVKSSLVKKRHAPPPPITTSPYNVSKQTIALSPTDDKKSPYSSIKTDSVSLILQQSSSQETVVTSSTSHVPRDNKTIATSELPIEKTGSPTGVLTMLTVSEDAETFEMRTPPSPGVSSIRSPTIMARAAFWDDKVMKGQSDREFPDMPSEML